MITHNLVSIFQNISCLLKSCFQYPRHLLKSVSQWKGFLLACDQNTHMCTLVHFKQTSAFVGQVIVYTNFLRSKVTATKHKNTDKTYWSVAFLDYFIQHTHYLCDRLIRLHISNQYVYIHCTGDIFKRLHWRYHALNYGSVISPMNLLHENAWVYYHTTFHWSFLPLSFTLYCYRWLHTKNFLKIWLSRNVSQWIISPGYSRIVYKLLLYLSCFLPRIHSQSAHTEHPLCCFSFPFFTCML